MRIAYLIAAHHKPRQFGILFDAIFDPDDLFVIHVDRKAHAEVHRTIAGLAAGRSNVLLLPSRPINWGGWGLVEVWLDAIRWLLERDSSWHYFINLSGQDYPLKPSSAIRAELASEPELNYIESARIDSFPRPDRIHLHRRMRYCRFEFAGRIVASPFPTWRWGVRTEWKGSGWFTLTRTFCQWVTTDFVARKCIAALRHTYMPDEFLMQTLAMNGPFAHTMAGNNRREIVWTGGSHPETLTLQHRERLLGSSAHFARKFDVDVDAEILDVLACHMGNARGQGPE